MCAITVFIKFVLYHNMACYDTLIKNKINKNMTELKERNILTISYYCIILLVIDICHFLLKIIIKKNSTHIIHNRCMKRLILIPFYSKFI